MLLSDYCKVYCRNLVIGSILDKIIKYECFVIRVTDATVNQRTVLNKKRIGGSFFYYGTYTCKPPETLITKDIAEDLKKVDTKLCLMGKMSSHL